MTAEHAVLAGGCFRVCKTVSPLQRRLLTSGGYIASDVSNPTYCNHGSHAESGGTHQLTGGFSSSSSKLTTHTLSIGTATTAKPAIGRRSSVTKMIL